MGQSGIECELNTTYKLMTRLKKKLIERSRICHKNVYLISSQSLNIDGRRGTKDDVPTIPFHLHLSSAALRESPNFIPVHSLMLYYHRFFCLPLLLVHFTVPCSIVFSMPEHLEMWPYHLCFFTMVRRSAFWILLQTSSFVTWSLLEMFRSLL